MSLRLPSWLTKSIRILPVRRQPLSPLKRRIARGMQISVTACLACFVVWRVHLYYQITRQFSAIRAAGLPTSAQELDRWHAAVPPSNNTALVLTQAFALLHSLPGQRSREIWQARLLDRRYEWTDGMREMVAEHVALNSNALWTAQAAFRRTQCRYPVDLSYGLETDLPHLSGLKDLARAAALKAILSVEEGRTEDWPQDVRFMLQLAATLESEPMVISQLVRNAIITMAVQTTERCLDSAPAGKAASGLEGPFGQAGRTNLIQMALIGERASAIPAFRMSRAEWSRVGETQEGPSAVSKPPPLGGRPNPFLWLSGFFERDLNFYLRAMETNIALAAQPAPASLAVTNVAGHLVDTARRRLYMLSSGILQVMANVVVRDAQTLARTHLVQTALAVERFRAKSGRLPEQLTELAPTRIPAILTDPFSGKPLRYRTLERGFLLYSVDRDGEDNDGRERPPDTKQRDGGNYDLTFTVER